MRFGVRGRSPGQLQRPTGVTVDMNGDIIVADYDNRWISIFSSDGKFKVTTLLQGEKKNVFFFFLMSWWCSASDPSDHHRARLALEDWWDPKVWLLTRTDTSSQRTTRPAASSSSSPTGSLSQSLEPEERPTDTLQVSKKIWFHSIYVLLTGSLDGRRMTLDFCGGSRFPGVSFQEHWCVVWSACF